MDPEVADIIRRVRGGQVDQYAEVVRRYQRQLWYIAAQALGDIATTEDIVQQAFINAFFALDRFDETRDFGAWLRTICRNLVREHIRKKVRGDAKMRRYGDHLETFSGDDDAEDRYEQHLRDALLRCREQLSPTAARALSLRYEESRNFGEIAAALDRTVAAARQLLTRVRQELRRCIEQASMGVSG